MVARGGIAAMARPAALLVPVEMTRYLGCLSKSRLSSYDAAPGTGMRRREFLAIAGDVAVA